MRKGMRKDYHKKAMKMIRELNKNTEQDPLWRGRFVAMVKGERWYQFSDNSGGILTLYIRMYDKKTKQYMDYRWEYAPYFHGNVWHLCMEIANDFVVEKIDVWHDADRPSIYNATDYHKEKMNWDKIITAPWAFDPWGMGKVE